MEALEQRIHDLCEIFDARMQSYTYGDSNIDEVLRVNISNEDATRWSFFYDESDSVGFAFKTKKQKLSLSKVHDQDWEVLGLEPDWSSEELELEGEGPLGLFTAFLMDCAIGQEED